MPIRLDADRHEYWSGDQRYAGVTSILDSVLGIKSRFWKPKHRIRGQFVHSITEAIDDLDFDTSLVVLPEGWSPQDRADIMGRADAYESFVDQTGFRKIEAELLVWSDSMMVAGTLDRIGVFHKGAHAGKVAIVDIKSGLPDHAAQLQVSLYDLLKQESHPELPAVDLRVVLQVKPNGKPKPTYRSGMDMQWDDVVARSVVNVYKWKQQHA